MDKDRMVEKLANYNRAIGRLREVVEEQNVNSYVYDSAIQRFEFSYELAWKLLKAFFEYKGTGELKFPKDVFREAFAVGFILDELVWLDMMKDRNLTSHTYDEAAAFEIYTHIKNRYFSHLAGLVEKVRGELE